LPPDEDTEIKSDEDKEYIENIEETKDDVNTDNEITEELVATEDKLFLESKIDIINYLDSSKNIILKDDHIYTDVYSDNKYFEAIKYFKNNETIS